VWGGKNFILSVFIRNQRWKIRENPSTHLYGKLSNCCAKSDLNLIGTSPIAMTTLANLPAAAYMKHDSLTKIEDIDPILKETPG
jgi:hypothetical protein